MSVESDSAKEALTSALAGPASVKTDAGEVQQQPLQDLIEAHRYISTLDATSKARRGLRFTRLLPGGTADNG